MDLNRLTEKAQMALVEAQGIATRLGHQAVDVEHLLAALVQQPEGLVPSLFERAGARQQALRGRIEQAVDALPRVVASTGPMAGIAVTQRLNELVGCHPAADDDEMLWCGPGVVRHARTLTGRRFQPMPRMFRPWNSGLSCRAGRR